MVPSTHVTSICGQVRNSVIYPSPRQFFSRRLTACVEMESEWRDVFVQKSIHDIREIVYDTRTKATAKKSELRTVVRYYLWRTWKLTIRHSHRDLLKTAHTVIEMQEVLNDVNTQYRKLMTYSPELISTRVINAEGYQTRSTGTIPSINGH